MLTSQQLFGLGESITILVPAGEIFGSQLSSLSEGELQVGLKVKHLISFYEKFILTVRLTAGRICRVWAVHHLSGMRQIIRVHMFPRPLRR